MAATHPQPLLRPPQPTRHSNSNNNINTTQQTRIEIKRVNTQPQQPNSPRLPLFDQSLPPPALQPPHRPHRPGQEKVTAKQGGGTTVFQNPLVGSCCRM